MKPYTWRAAILKSNLKPTTRHVLLTLSCYINDVGQSAYPSIKTLAKDTGLTERAVGTHLHVASDSGWLRVGKHGFGGQKWANNEYFPQIPDAEVYEESEAEAPGYVSDKKVRARKVVGNAVASGRLSKDACVTCGSHDAEAHHADYSNPLDVTWLCRPCHIALHASLKKGKEASSSPSEKVRNVVPKGQERGSEGEEPRSKGQELRSGEVRNDVPTNYPLELSKEVSKELSTELSSKSGKPLPAVEQVFAYWQQVMQTPRAKLDAKRRAAVQARLKDGYTIEDLMLAIDGCRKSDWHMGRNDKHKVFNDLELICRDAARVDSFMAQTQQKPVVPSNGDADIQGYLQRRQQRMSGNDPFTIDMEA